MKAELLPQPEPHTKSSRISNGFLISLPPNCLSFLQHHPIQQLVESLFLSRADRGVGHGRSRPGRRLQ